MKSKKTLISLIGLSVVAVLFSVVWVSHGNSCSDGGGGGWGKGGCDKGGDSLLGGICANLPSPCGLLSKKDEIGLSGDQESKLKKLKSSSKKAKVRLYAEIQIITIEIQELLDEKSVDKGAAHAKLEAIGKLRIQKSKNCLDSKLSARELLSAEQLKKWEASKKACKLGEPKCDGKKGKKVSTGSQAKKECDSKSWVDMSTKL